MMTTTIPPKKNEKQGSILPKGAKPREPIMNRASHVRRGLGPDAPGERCVGPERPRRERQRVAAGHDGERRGGRMRRVLLKEPHAVLDQQLAGDGALGLGGRALTQTTRGWHRQLLNCPSPVFFFSL
jgi:hypothetical protein